MGCPSRRRSAPSSATDTKEGRGPQPSEQILASIAHGLALTPEEHKHLLLLAGHRPAPRAGATGTHIPGGLARILDRLDDTPAEIVTEVGQTLRQTPMGVALLGDLTHFEGLSRNLPYRWFTGPEGRARYAPDDHERLSRLYVSGLREVAVRRGPGSPAAQLVEVLLRESQEFRDLWELQEVGLRPSSGKRFMHPDVGLMELECQTLIDPDSAHLLLVYTATPGSESKDKLDYLVGRACPPVQRDESRAPASSTP